jgi:hypothetical protein
MFVNLGRIMHCQSLDGINWSGSILKVKGLEKYKGHSRIQSQISASMNSKCHGIGHVISLSLLGIVTAKFHHYFLFKSFIPFLIVTSVTPAAFAIKP